MTADAQRNLSRAARAAQSLEKLYAMKNAFDQYKKLNQGVRDNSAEVVQARLKSAQMKKAYQDQYNQVEQMRQSYDKLKAVYRANKKSMSADEQVGMKASIRAAKEELKAQEQILRSMSRENLGQTQKTRGLENQLNRQRSELASLQASLRSAGANLSDMAAQESRLRAEIERTTQALERQQHLDMRRQNFANAQQNMSNAYSNFQDSMSTAQTIMSPIKSAVDEAVSFEAAMSKIKALTQVKNIRAGDIERVNREMGELQETIMQIGATTEFTNLEVAGAAQKYAMSGWSKDQIIGALPTTIDIATASGEKDLIKIGDYLSDEMQALGLMKGSPQEVSKNMAHYGDVMAYALTQSNNDLESFHQAMKYFAPVGTQLGMKPEEMVAAVMTQADAGIKGSMGGTSMRMASLRMFAPPKAALKALGDMGELSSDAQKGLAEASAAWAELGVSEDAGWLDRMRALKEASQTLSKTDFMAKLSKITGVNAVSGQSSLLADFEKFESRLTEMTDGTVNGWAGDTAKVMRENTETNFKLLESAVSALSTTFGNLFLPALNEGLSGLTKFATELNTFVKEHQDLAKAAGLAAAAIAGVIVAVAGFGVAASGVQFLASSFALLKTTVSGLSAVQGVISGLSSLSNLAGLAGLASPLGIAVAAAMALAAAAYFVYQNWETVGPVFSAMGETISSTLSNAFQAIQPAVSTLIESFRRLAPVFETLGAGLFAAFAVVLNFSVNIAATLISTFANAVAAIINLFGGLGNALASLLAGDFSKAGEHLKNALVNAAKSAFEAIKSLLGGLADSFTNLFTPLKFLRGDKPDGSNSGGGSFGTPQATAQPQQVDNSALIAAIANAVENTQRQNSDADWSKVTAAISTAVESVKADPKTDIVPQLQAISTAIESVKKENPEADTAKLEAVLSSAMSQIQAQQAAQVEQKNLEVEPLQEAVAQTADSMNQFAPTMQTAAEGVNQMTAGQQAFNSSVQESQSVISGTNAQVQASQGALASFNGALQSTNGGLANLASSSTSAAGAISGVGNAAQSAVAALTAAGANAAAAVNAAAANVGKPAANFRGGIYSKGAFLTTFAEKSPEAAIPIDKSQRAIDLWTKTGQMLGIEMGRWTDGKMESSLPPMKSAPTAQKMTTLERAQRQRLEQVKAQYEAAKKAGALNSTAIEYDELGNIKGLNGLKDNVITKDDDIQVARAKKEAQMAEWRKSHSTGIESRQKSFPRSIFSGRVQNPMPDIFRTTQTQPRTYDTGLNIGDLLGGIGGGNSGGMLTDLLNNLPQQSESSPIDLHFEINIQGNANAEDVEQGIRQSIPMLEETFERKLANFKHEQQRRSF